MIYVFKTTVFTEKDIELLRPNIDELPHTRWNFDLEDCDNILRIDAPTEISEVIIQILHDKGFDCKELTD